MRKELVLKILNITACVFLNVILVLGVAFVPFYYSITALTEPETVAMVMREVDYKRVVEQNPSIKRTLQKYDITPQEANTIMKSKQTGDLIEVYADEITKIFLDIPDDKRIDVQYLKEVVDANSQKFIEITEKNTDIKLKSEKTQKNIDKFFAENKVEIEESITFIKTVKDVVTTVHTSSVIKNSLTLWGALILVAIAFILIAAIIALMRSNSFFWIGMDFSIVTIFLCVVIAFSKSSFVSLIAINLSDFGTQIIESAISISTEKIIIALFGTAIFAVLFVGFFVLVKLLKRKYQNWAVAEAISV